MIGEASDGLEAVRKAEELQPDIVLMDIGLPELNGIDAARQIMKVAPHSRIVFVTQESSPEVVEETMRLGACGYVLKSDIGTALLRAVDSTLEGKGFFRNRNGHSSFSRGKTPL
jgi:DNA-binding NarL/FixJ family response regulator